MSLVQVALDFIDAASEEEILLCREKALDAVQKLERVLGLPPRVILSLRVEPPSIDPLEKSSRRVLDSIQKDLASILSLGRKEAKDALEQAPLSHKDPRVIDARIYRVATKKKPKLMLQTALAIRNISMDFAKFQNKKRGDGHSRVAKQVKWLTSNSDKTQDEATIDAFIKKNHIADSETFKWMIVSGTKMLVLEELFGSCGISALLWRLPSWYKMLSYPELIRRAAEDLTKWYEKCQRLYDNNIKVQQAMFKNHPTIPTRHLPESMSDDDTVVSYTGTSMTGDQSANDENHTEVYLHQPYSRMAMSWGPKIFALCKRISYIDFLFPTKVLLAIQMDRKQTTIDIMTSVGDKAQIRMICPRYRFIVL